MEASLIRVGAVSYLNTVPLVWGMLHGEQREQVDLSFSIPSVCSREMAEGKIDVGLVPVAEIARQDLHIVSDLGIASHGPVRSILLISQVPWQRIRTLSVDHSSRTSVQLARVILRERYGVEPTLTSEPPKLQEMLAGSDAALLIGDAALAVDPSTLPFQYLDLGAEWKALTGLPMVFAAWSAKSKFPDTEFPRIARSSYEYGKEHLEQIIDNQWEHRRISKALATAYFSQYIQFELGPKELQGLEAFFELAELMPSRSR